MSRNFWYGLVFFTFFLLVACWKLWAWIVWKVLNLNKDKQVFQLIAKSRFIEISGASGKGKSWLLCHLFKNLKGVKFTNMPTPQGTYTLTPQTCESHWVGKWAAPNRFFYFLDDIVKFEEWGQKNMNQGAYQEWQKYCASSGKLGGTFVWTNNGLDKPAPPPFAGNCSEKWVVKGYITFMDYSLLLVIKGWRPVFIPIDNKEIEGFYDPRWNISKEWNRNWIKEVCQNLQAKELNQLLEIVDNKHDPEEDKYDRAVLENYLRVRKKEEAIYEKKKSERERKKSEVMKFGLNDKPLDQERVEKFNKRKSKEKDLVKKGRKIKINQSEKEQEINLDQNNDSQEGEEEE
jgi:hypothetical protein